MSYSMRFFCLSPSGELLTVPIALANKLFLQDAATIPAFADARIRFCEVMVELKERKPVSVLRTWPHIVRFKQDGAVDMEQPLKQAVAKPDSRKATPDESGRVLDAGSLFLARGSEWHMDAAIRKRIHSAALGSIKPKRVDAQPLVPADIPASPSGRQGRG